MAFNFPLSSSLNSRQKGNIGEDIACKFLMKQGYFIVERNYLKKWGEIDIVALKDDKLHFIEVKSVSQQKSDFRPEENVHVLKRARLRRTLQTYLVERKINQDMEFFFDVVVIYMNLKTRRASLSLIENVIL